MAIFRKDLLSRTATLLLLTVSSIGKSAETERRFSAFQATDGSEITVDYRLVEKVSPGAQILTVVDWAQISVNFAQFPNWNHQTRAKFTNYCEDNYGISAITYDCPLSQGTGGAPFSSVIAPAPDRCSIVAGNGFLEENHPDILVSYQRRNGLRGNCRQQLEIINNGQYLNDSFDGTSYFEFNMNY